VVTELKESGNGVMVSASKEEGKGTQLLGPLGPQRFEPPYVSMSSLPIEEHYVRFEVFMALTMKNGVFWDVTPCGSCKNRRLNTLDDVPAWPQFVVGCK
jgi:hypothetical protein